jgi:hypothetical protein
VVGQDRALLGYQPAPTSQLGQHSLHAWHAVLAGHAEQARSSQHSAWRVQEAGCIRVAVQDHLNQAVHVGSQGHAVVSPQWTQSGQRGCVTGPHASDQGWPEVG